MVPEFFLNRLGIPTTYGRIICGFFFLFINLFIIYLLLAKTNLLDNFIDKFLKFEPKITSVYINLLVIIIFTLLLYFISIFCYTVSLKLDRIEFKKSETNYVNTILTLGGSTSDPRKAMLLLYNDQNELINYQPIRSLMGNKYVSTVNISNLKEGIYILKLLYPHYKLSANPPFIKSMIQEAKYFSIAP